MVTGLLLAVAYILREDIIALEQQNTEQYRRMRELTTDLLKLKEIIKYDK